MIHRTLTRSAVVAASAAAVWLAAPASAFAQMGGSSLLPYTTYGYVGLNVGASHYNTPCAGSFSCDNPNVAGKIYTGGMISKAFGLELGYLNMGNADRNGGTTKAQGVNISLVGNLPVTDSFSVFAKGGATYGWTNISAAPGTVPTGDENGFGLSYGAGLGYDVSRAVQVVAEWDRNRFKFVSGRDNVDLYSAGVRFKF
jgi:OmpA-OmpF porin, OOP family